MTSNEPLPTPSMNATSRSRVLVYINHAILFLLATAAGAALIYFLQPPSSNSLVYELTLVTSDKPINDFPLQLSAIHQRRPGRLALSVNEMYGGIHLTSAPGQVTQLQLAPLPGQITTYLGNKGFDFELRGDLIGDRVRTHLKIVDNDTTSFHQFELREGEYCAVLVPHGENDRRPCCYAFIKVSRVNAAPVARFKTRNSWFPSNRRPSSPTKGP